MSMMEKPLNRFVFCFMFSFGLAVLNSLLFAQGNKYKEEFKASPNIINLSEDFGRLARLYYDTIIVDLLIPKTKIDDLSKKEINKQNFGRYLSLISLQSHLHERSLSDKTVFRMRILLIHSDRDTNFKSLGTLKIEQYFPKDSDQLFLKYDKVKKEVNEILLTLSLVELAEIK